MSAIGNRRSTIVMYSDAASIHSHRIRLALAEKKIDAEIVTVNADDISEDLRKISPQGDIPTIVDRDLALYGPSVIMEYLDERYPHPPFMPVDPVSRAHTRLALYRIETDWYSLRPDAPGQTLSASEAGKLLNESLTAAAQVFAAMPYFFSDEYSILDATLAPLLWRLPAYGIVLPEAAEPVKQYAQRIFAREAFQNSLSDAEREMEK